MLTRTDERTKNEGDENDASKKYKNTFVLNDNIESALGKMAKDSYNDSSKKIPPNFNEFARSAQFKDLLQAMLDYNRVSTPPSNQPILGVVQTRKQTAGPRIGSKAERSPDSTGLALRKEKVV